MKGAQRKGVRGATKNRSTSEFRFLARSFGEIQLYGQAKLNTPLFLQIEIAIWTAGGGLAYSAFLLICGSRCYLPLGLVLVFENGPSSPKAKGDPIAKHRRLLRWAGHVSHMPKTMAPRKPLTSWAAKSCPFGSPPNDVGPGAQQGPPSCQRPEVKVPSTFTKWGDIAEYLDQTRVHCGAKAGGAVHTPLTHPRGILAQVTDGSLPSNPAIRRRRNFRNWLSLVVFEAIRSGQ